MKILPVAHANNISSKGRLAQKTCLMIGDVQVGINNAFKSCINKDTKFVLNT